MKATITKKVVTIALVSLGVAGLITVNGCVESKEVAAKSGAQLWAENCSRCHNTPAPTTFSQEQWKTVGMHMQSRALLTNNERDKIVEFLQQSNQ
jgi:nitrate/TMAO reductase-like tetraheme cytochrome c subunit